MKDKHVAIIALILVGITYKGMKYLLRSSPSIYTDKEYVKYPCDLQGHIDDTVYVKGRTLRQKNHERFLLSEKDKCQLELAMDLDFSQTALFTDEIKSEYKKVDYADKTQEMILYGVLRRYINVPADETERNRYALEVIKVLRIGDIKSVWKKDF
jgi:hypothetical protein